jgi:hypothetical protein
MGSFNLDNYETVEDRLAKFWLDHKQGRIHTSIAYYDDTRILVRAEVYFDRDDSRAVATGYAEEVRGASPVNRTSHAENAETSAIGRALANCGYAAKGARPSREEMSKVARGPVATPPLTVDLLTKFRDACAKAGIKPEEVALKASIDLHTLRDADMPRLRDAFKSMQEQAKVPTAKPEATVLVSVDDVIEAFDATVIEPEVKDKTAKASNAQIGKVRALLNAAGHVERNDQADAISEILMFRVEKLDFLKKGDADNVIKVLLKRQKP